MNQSKLEVITGSWRKAQKTRASESRLVLVLLLIGSKIGANFLSQLCSVANAEPITFRQSNENRSKVQISNTYIERFSLECRQSIGFALCTPHDWLKKFAPLFHSIRRKTKTNPDSLAHVFPRFFSATCNYFEFWLVHCIVCVPCDWLE